MTATLIEPSAEVWLQPERVTLTVKPWLMRMVASVWWWLSLIAAGQIVLAFRPGYNSTAFEDEGLYVYMGHRMIAHWLHGSFIQEYPGSYFSGAPAFYPVFAALGDSVAGLNGARGVSLVFAVIAMVAVCGLGSQLFGKVAGIVGAAAFAVNGSVIMLSHFATYDSCMMAFIACAAWLTAYTAKRDMLVWIPAVWALLACAFFAKYAGAVYIPVVAMLGAAVGWNRLRWTAIRQAGLIALGSVGLIYGVIAVDGQSLTRGIISTTAARHVLNAGSTAHMLSEVGAWVGVWLLVALAGLIAIAMLRPKHTMTGVALAFGSVVGIAQQVRIHEETSFSKHVAFGLIFAAPLIGALFSALITARWHAAKLVGAALITALFAMVLVPTGLSNARTQLTFWVDDAGLIAPLQQAIARTPNKHILGESPSPEKYALRKTVDASLWNDTYQLYYKGEHGEPAFERAVRDDHFGVIYLTSATPFGRYVQNLLTTKQTKDYRLLYKIPRYRHTTLSGYWLVYGLINPTTDG